MSLNNQVGGNHYQKLVIQPIEFITRNNIPFCEGNIVKYISRYKFKDGIKDLHKALHYVALIKEYDKWHNISWISTIVRPIEYVTANQFGDIESNIIIKLINRNRVEGDLEDIAVLIKNLIEETGNGNGTQV
jgi:hypothetical protein